jgi:hypothetical protein
MINMFVDILEDAETIYLMDAIVSNWEMTFSY